MGFISCQFDFGSVSFINTVSSSIALTLCILNDVLMFQRFALAAAELNGALYAVGGYDGDNYLK